MSSEAKTTGGRAKEFTTAAIEVALDAHEGNVARAADALGCTRQTIYAAMRGTPSIASAARRARRRAGRDDGPMESVAVRLPASAWRKIDGMRGSASRYEFLRAILTEAIEQR